MDDEVIAPKNSERFMSIMSKLLVDKVGLDGRNKLSNFLEVPGANPANIRFKILNTQTRHMSNIHLHKKQVILRS